MNAMATTAPVIPGKLDEWKEFGRDLGEGPHHNDFTAFMKKCGVSRIRCWLQEGPGGPVGIILYEGETPAEFVRQIGSSQEPFAVWFRDKIRECNGVDLAELYLKTIDVAASGYMIYRTIHVYPQVDQQVNKAIELVASKQMTAKETMKQAQENSVRELKRAGVKL